MKREDRHNLNALMAFFDQVQGKKAGELMPQPLWDELFKKLSPPQRDILESREPVNLFMAGQGSGKTHGSGAISALLIHLFPNIIGLIAANTYDQLNRSTMKRIKEVWKTECGWEEYNPYTGQGHYCIGITPPPHFEKKHGDYERYNNIITFANGCTIYIGSLDNYKALDGMEIGWAILDETKDTREEAVKEVIIGRLRQKGIYTDAKGRLTDKERNGSKGRAAASNSPFNPLYIFTSPAKVPWINDWFELDKHEVEISRLIYGKSTYFKKKVGTNKFVTISSTYLNEKNLPASYIPNQIANLPVGLQDMLIFGSPFAKAGGEFYKSFNRANHTAKIAYNPDLPLHISFDFNVNPYVSLLVWQMEAGYVLQIDEICLEPPKNKTLFACQEFKRRYKHHRAGLFVYGDPAGKHEDTRSERGYNDYAIIMNELRTFFPHKRVESKAPPVVKRGEFMDAFFEEKVEGLKIRIADHCTTTIAEYSHLKEAADGTKLKEKAVHPHTKVAYEKYGHVSDANDYFFCAAFKAQFNAFLRGGAPKRPPRSGFKSRFDDR